MRYEPFLDYDETTGLGRVVFDPVARVLAHLVAGREKAPLVPMNPGVSTTGGTSLADTRIELENLDETQLTSVAGPEGARSSRAERDNWATAITKRSRRHITGWRASHHGGRHAGRRPQNLYRAAGPFYGEDVHLIRAGRGAPNYVPVGELFLMGHPSSTFVTPSEVHVGSRLSSALCHRWCRVPPEIGVRIIGDATNPDVLGQHALVGAVLQTLVARRSQRLS